MIKRKNGILTALVSAILLFGLSACSFATESQSSESSPTESSSSSSSSSSSEEEEPTVVERGSVDPMLQNFWQTDTMRDESVLLVAETDSSGNVISAPRAKLLFTPTQVSSVKWYYHPNNSGVRTFTEADYSIENGYIVAKGNIRYNTESQHNDFDTAMPYITDRQYKGEDPFPGLGENKDIPSVNGGYLPFTEYAQIVQMQLSVSYRHSETWNGNVPSYYGQSALSRTVEKLSKREKVELFVFGDSISTGATSSAVLKIAPYLKTWPELVAENLASYYMTTVNLTNKAVGGFTSRDGASGGSGWIHGVPTTQPGLADLLNEGTLSTYSPDIALIGFGMNDATNGITKNEYIQNTVKMIEALRNRNPLCDIILVGTWRPNPDASYHNRNQHELSQTLAPIASLYEGIAVVDMWDMHTDILNKGKKYTEISSNNVNHPNDFMTRVYAMNMLSALIEA